MTERVVLLHGVWMPASEMKRIKRRLEVGRAFRARLFSYPSVRGTLDENADALADFVLALNVEPVHLVGHSLGGIVALRALHRHALPPGRVVCLGSPLCGSLTARAFMRHRWGKHVIGAALATAVLTEPASTWAETALARREVGVIAGDRPAGVGRVVTRFTGPNDGTVAVAETELRGISDHLVLPVSHSGMVLSSEVATQTAAFLQHGAFTRS